jgi:GTPase involved in cell partitioning and DNA repair
VLSWSLILLFDLRRGLPRYARNPHFSRFISKSNEEALMNEIAQSPIINEKSFSLQGLGRMFLRHLRRTRLLVHVVDASNPDPLQDFLTLREVSRL